MDEPIDRIADVGAFIGFGWNAIVCRIWGIWWSKSCGYTMPFGFEWKSYLCVGARNSIIGIYSIVPFHSKQKLKMIYIIPVDHNNFRSVSTFAGRQEMSSRHGKTERGKTPTGLTRGLSVLITLDSFRFYKFNFPIFACTSKSNALARCALNYHFIVIAHWKC